MINLRMRHAALGLTLCVGAGHAQQAANTQWLDLPTSKQLMMPAPGNPQRVNSLPMSLAVSPDRRWVVSLNAGYGTFESGYMQSLAVIDARSGAVRDFPEPRTLLNTRQAFFAGLAFSTDGTRVYASLASSTDLQGDGHQNTGNGIVVYAFSDGELKPDRFLPLPAVVLAPRRHSSLLSSDGHTVSPYPAAIGTVSGAHDSILVAENLSDSVALLDVQTGLITRSFDLSVSENVPATYPIAVAATQDGTRAFVALWNVSEVVELDLVEGTVSGRLSLLKPKPVFAPGSHPSALLLDERAGLLYAALSNRDAVAAISIGKKGGPHEFAVRGYFDTRLPGQSYFGAEPGALAQNDDGSRLYAANLGSDAVAILDPRRLVRTSAASRSRGAAITRDSGMIEPIGFVPTELMPIALASDGRNLYVASAKGKGTGPNSMAQRPTDATQGLPMTKLKFTYGPTLLYGSIARIDEAGIESGLKAATDAVLQSNRMKAAQETIQFAGGVNPIKHVIYVLK
ncbi:MAG: YncE family protein, partial [Steroidobacteraceae bacterium]